MPNSLIERYDLDPLDRMRGIDLSLFDAGEFRSIWRQTYELDIMDRVATRHDSRVGRTDFQYDAGGQLVMAQGVNVERFAYDAAGNRVFGGENLVNYDAENRVASDGTRGFSFDERGNRISATSASGAVRYEYDLRDQLISMSHADGSRTEYAYDVFSRRICKRRGSRTTEYVWLGHQMVQQIVTDGDVRQTAEFLYLPGDHRPLAMRENGKVYYYHCDRLGTPQLVSDAQGAVVWAAQYDSFGTATIQVQQVSQPFRFPGQYFDEESGLHYNRDRYYDPGLGSYLSADPAFPAGSGNLYRYVSGNPINLSDPLGLFGESWPGWVKTTVSVAGSIAVGLAVVALAPEIATVGAAALLVVGVGALAGAAGFGLNAAMTPGACVPCAMLEGGIIGAIAALPFAAAIIFGGPIAAMGVGTVAAIGAASGALGYVADCALYDRPWDTGEFVKTVAISAATAGLFHYVAGKYFPEKGASEPPGEDPAAAPTEETPAERTARKRAELRNRANETDRDARLRDGMDEADKNGKFEDLSQEDQEFLNEDPRNKALAYDKDIGGYRPGEARQALAAEDGQVLKGPVRRAITPSESGGDFVDGDNQVWDGKDAAEGPDNIVSKATDPKNPENVLVDDRNLSPADRAQLKQNVSDGMARRPGTGQVRYLSDATPGDATGGQPPRQPSLPGAVKPPVGRQGAAGNDDRSEPGDDGQEGSGNDGP